MAEENVAIIMDDPNSRTGRYLTAILARDIQTESQTFHLSTKFSPAAGQIIRVRQNARCGFLCSRVSPTEIQLSVPPFFCDASPQHMVDPMLHAIRRELTRAS